jgi:FMN-dependent NADH-azoreductase
MKGKRKKTLIVSYLPRKEQSNTKILLDKFKEKITDYEELDLTENVPDFFLVDNLLAYYKRNYGQQKLTAIEEETIKKMDDMTKQFKSADVIVFAYPMYNFSMPAIVKAYFDSVLLKGETWDMNETGYIGLTKDKNAIVLTTSGGVYTKEMGTLAYDMNTPLVSGLLNFMGVKSAVISAQGINMFPDKKDSIINAAVEEINKAIKQIY